MEFISKAGSCVVDNTSKAFSFVRSKLPNPTLKNTVLSTTVVALFSARSRVLNIALNTLRFVGSKLPNPTLKNAAILMVVVALLYKAYQPCLVKWLKNMDEALSGL